jgi:hypothetical protein
MINPDQIQVTRFDRVTPQELQMFRTRLLPIRGDATDEQLRQYIYH